MTISKERMSKIKETFDKEYFFSNRYQPYINGTGISTLREQSADLREGESLDDYCFLVILKEDPENKIELPLEYQGVRVFYRNGEIVPQINHPY